MSPRDSSKAKPTKASTRTRSKSGASSKAAEPKTTRAPRTAKSAGKAPVLSMTGYGKTTLRSARFSGSIEIRSFNHRHLKLAVKVPAILSSYESKIEQAIRDRIARGSVSLTIKLVSKSRRAPFEFDDQVIGGYVTALRDLAKRHGLAGDPTLDLVAQLPEALVAIEPSEAVSDGDWRSLRADLAEAVDKLVAMRTAEGAKLEKDIVRHRKDIAKSVKQIARVAPGVVETYREKLHQRVAQLAGADVPVDSSDLAREIAVFADRCDISEELARLDSHLRQFDEIVRSGVEAGRSLEFILHEMFREVNTIGSKANDSTISHLVVDIKATIEKIREQVLNIE